MKKSCCILGQKRVSFKKHDDVFEAVFEQVKKLIKQGYSEFIFEGQGQFDNIARLVVRILSLGEYPHIKTVYYQSYNDGNMENLPPVFDKAIPFAKNRPDKQNTACYNQVMQVMIDKADFCLFYVTNKLDGLKEAVRYAAEQNKPFVNLAKSD